MTLFDSPVNGPNSRQLLGPRRDARLVEIVVVGVDKPSGPRGQHCQLGRWRFRRALAVAAGSNLHRQLFICKQFANIYKSDPGQKFSLERLLEGLGGGWPAIGFGLLG